MRLFRLPKRDPRYMGDETPWQRLVRYLLIVLLFCAVIFGFWLNNQRRMEMLKRPSSARIDSTGSLNEEQQRQLADYAEEFRRAYGVALHLNISAEPCAPAGSGAVPDAVSLTIVPGRFQVCFDAPPLAAAALGSPVALYLRKIHFLPYFVNNSWPEGLQAALNLLSARLDAALLPRHAARTQ